MTHNKALSHKRKERKLSAKDVAESVDVHVDTYRKWESGKIRPGLHHLRRLCETLQTTPEEIGYSEYM
jgi:transcriptional regulator with XRE-family HTH domain